MLDWKLDPQTAINLPNFGSRNGPTEIEKGLVTPGLKAALVDRGHSVSETEMTSGTQMIMRIRDSLGQWVLVGAADPRREGVALGD